MIWTTGTPRRTAPTGLLAVGLFVVVAGLLGMHGLASHGASAGGHGPAAHPSVDVSDQPAGSVSAHAAVAATYALDLQLPRNGKSLAGLCLAVLSALTLAFGWAVLHRPGPGPWPARQRRIAATAGRGREPPSLSHLSVLRR